MQTKQPNLHTHKFLSLKQTTLDSEIRFPHTDFSTFYTICILIGTAVILIISAVNIFNKKIINP